MAGSVKVREVRKYAWECPNSRCNWSTTSDSKTTTANRAKRHLLMDAIAPKGTRVKIRWRRTVTARSLFPAHNGDTGAITYAYVDQDRYGVTLDRKGKCEGCSHCDGCGQAKPLHTEVSFDDLEAI